MGIKRICLTAAIHSSQALAPAYSNKEAPQSGKTADLYQGDTHFDCYQHNNVKFPTAKLNIMAFRYTEKRKKYLHTFLIMALDVGDFSASRYGLFI